MKCFDGQPEESRSQIRSQPYFLEGKNKLTKYRIGNYEITLASDKQALTFDNYKRHDEFSTENDEKTATIYQSMSV